MYVTINHSHERFMSYITLLEWPKVQILLNHYNTQDGEIDTENS